VTPAWDPKSIGAETTFPEDTDDPSQILKTLLALSDRVGARLRRQGFVARGVTLKFRDETFTTATRSAVLREPTDVGEEIYRTATSLLDRLSWRGRRTRLVGVTATHLGPRAPAGEQLDLFAPPDKGRRHRLARAVDDIRGRFGDRFIDRAALLEKEDKKQ
jgi:DNA polymerase-4